MYVLHFKRKLYSTQIGVNGAILYPKSLPFNFSLNPLGFSVLVPDDRHIENFEVTVLDFEEKSLLSPKLGKWVIFGHKINTFELFSESVL